ncbi:hypothetical protein GEMRC1_002821 [Eukaryota sp. GEM-RC1]
MSPPTSHELIGDLFVYYDFRKPFTTIVEDLSGNGHTGISTATYSADGGYASFPTSSDTVTVSDITFSKEHVFPGTIITTIYVMDRNQWFGLRSSGSNVYFESSREWYEIYNRIEFYYGSAFHRTRMSLNQWHILAMRMSSNGVVSFFLNGDRLSSSFGESFSDNLNSQFVIGANFHGRMRTFRMYTRALTDDEISVLSQDDDSTDEVSQLTGSGRIEVDQRNVLFESGTSNQMTGPIRVTNGQVTFKSGSEMTAFNFELIDSDLDIEDPSYVSSDIISSLVLDNVDLTPALPFTKFTQLSLTNSELTLIDTSNLVVNKLTIDSSVLNVASVLINIDELIVDGSLSIPSSVKLIISESFDCYNCEISPQIVLSKSATLNCHFGCVFNSLFSSFNLHSIVYVNDGTLIFSNGVQYEGLGSLTVTLSNANFSLVHETYFPFFNLVMKDSSCFLEILADINPFSTDIKGMGHVIFQEPSQLLLNSVHNFQASSLTVTSSNSFFSCWNQF